MEKEPKKEEKLKVVKAEGSFFEVGQIVGRKTRKEILLLISTTTRCFSDAEKYQKNYSTYLNELEKVPEAVEYLKGMAKGARVDFELIAKLNLTEIDRPIEEKEEHCTTLIIKKKDRFLIGHNEDGAKEDYGIFLLRAKFNNSIKMDSICYFGSLPGFSFTTTSKGLILFNNSLTTKDRQVGVPKRAVLFSISLKSNINDILNYLNNTKRADGQNFIVLQNKQLVNVETSATKIVVKEINSNFVHCNNYLESELKEYERKEDKTKGTFIRTENAKKLIKNAKTIEDLKKILSTHEDRPSCFCSHQSEHNDYNETLGSIFFDTKKKLVEIGIGYTCKKNFVKKKYVKINS